MWALAPRLERLNDVRPEFRNLYSILLGPFVMVGLTSFDNVLVADPAKVTDWIVPEAQRGGSMLAHMSFRALGSNSTFVLLPLNSVVEQNYTVYFSVQAPKADSQAVLRR